MAELNGVRIAVTRPTAQAGGLMANLESRGAKIIPCPVIRISPPDDILPLASARRGAAMFDWIIFTSANGVEGFLGGGTPKNLPNVAAIGPATEAALARRGVISDFMPETYLAENIPAGLGNLAGKRVLLPRARRAGAVLPNALADAGADVTEVAAYQTLQVDPGAKAAHELRAGVAAICFTSPSTVEGFVAALVSYDVQLEDPLAACIGPVTANAANNAGFTRQIIATEHTASGLATTVLRHFEAIG